MNKQDEWVQLDSTDKSVVALFLELEHNQVPVQQYTGEHCWGSVYHFEDSVYRVTLFHNDAWTLEVRNAD